VENRLVKPLRSDWSLTFSLYKKKMLKSRSRKCRVGFRITSFFLGKVNEWSNMCQPGGKLIVPLTEVKKKLILKSIEVCQVGTSMFIPSGRMKDIAVWGIFASLAKILIC